MIASIPEEMKQFNQFVVWRYEELQGGKPTKIPYCPHSYGMASVTDYTTWGTFEQAMRAFNTGSFSGIGFVLTENDPYCFIDLDNPFEIDQNGNQKYSNASEIMQRQIKIHSAFESYSEKSPSGLGLHIICKASVPSGRRKDAVEVYSSARYMTMTGEVFNNSPIMERQEFISMLWAEMAGSTGYIKSAIDEPQKYTDEEIIQKAKDASNGAKFNSLFIGEWNEFYVSQSEADFSLINMLAFYTQNRDQIKRIFLSSALGQRAKAKRLDYMAYMINKSFDRMLPPVDMTGLKMQMTEILEKKEPVKQTVKVNGKDPYIFPPGLVGDIANFIYAQSVYPVKEISLAAALSFMSGLCGKSYNVSGTGLNNYIVLLAKTGRGKEAMAKGIDKIINEVKKTVPSVVDFIGPAEFASPQGMVKHLNTSPCFVSVLTEFALVLEQMTGVKANSNATGLRRMFLNLYNKSGYGQTLGGIVYSDRDKNTHSVYAPAFSFLGECTPDKYYKLLDEDMVAEGLLPRFTTIEYLGNRCNENENHNNVEPNQELVNMVAQLASNSLMLISNNNIIKVEFDSESKKLFKNYNAKCSNEINKSDLVASELWTRSHVKAMKLAAVVAVGVNPWHPCITVDVANWAIDIINHDNLNITSKFEVGEVGTNNTDIIQVKEALRIIKEFAEAEFKTVEKYKVPKKMHDNLIVPYKYLAQRVAPLSCFRKDHLGSTNALKRAIQAMLDSGDIQEVPIGQSEREFGIRAKCYAYKNNRSII